MITSGLTTPQGVAVDSYGNVYVSDFLTDEILMWSPVTKQVTTLLSGLNKPSGVTVDSQGNLYFTQGDNTVEKWTASTQQVSTVVGSGIQGSNQPWVTVTGQTATSVSYTVVANTSAQSRSAILNIQGQQVTIQQNGGARAIPAFGALTSSQTISYGTASISLAGKITATSTVPPSGETVTITINGVSITAAIGSNGSFASNFSTATIPASKTPYPISYQYAGDTNFASASNTSTTLTVMAAPLTVTANNATRQQGDPNPSFTDTIKGLENGDNITATYSTTTTVTSAPGGYPIVPALADPNNRLGNYVVTVTNGTLIITPGPVASILPSSVNFGDVRLLTKAVRDVTLTNTGAAPMMLTRVDLESTGSSPDEFKVSNQCPTALSAGKSCVIVVTFFPDSDVSTPPQR